MLSRRSIAKLSLGLAGAAAIGRLGVHSACAAYDSVRIAYSTDVASWDPIGTGQGLTVPMHKSVFDMPISFNLT